MQAARKSICAALAALVFAWSTNAAAQEIGAPPFEPFVVEDIRVEGLSRFDAGLIFRTLNINIGDNFNAAAAITALRAIHETGYFQDVRLLRSGDILVVRVVENPTISQISFSGLTEFDEDEVLPLLTRAGVETLVLFNRAALERAVAVIKRLYAEKSYYRVEVSPVTSPLPENRIAINFNIAPGAQAAVRSVRLTGVEQGDIGALRDEMELAPKSIFTWLNDRHLFTPGKLQADLDRLRTYYLERGNLRYELLSAQTELSPELTDIHLVVNISEGRRYAVAGASFSGESPLSEEELAAMVAQQEGEIYDYSQANLTSQNVRDLLGDMGYLNAEVRLNPRLEDEDGTVWLEYEINAGRPHYVRRIEIVGNHFTRDDVIRRELLLFERELYSRDKLDESLRRLRRLGFFSQVQDRLEPAGEDEVDLEIEVEEGSPGFISGGVSYSQSSKFGFSFDFKHSNLFGTGNELNLNFAYSDDDKSLNTEINQPYYTADGISRHFGFALSDSDSGTSVSDFSLNRNRLFFGYGIPTSLNEVVRADLVYEHIDIKNPEKLNTSYRPFVTKYGDSSHAALLNVYYTRDTRDSAGTPTEGSRLRLNSEAALPVLDLRYFRLTYNYDWYKRLGKSETAAVLHLRGFAGVGGDYDDGIYPFYRRFFAGGPNSVRGFDTNALSPKNAAGSVVGGEAALHGGVEISYDWRPFRNQNTRWVGFVDFGGAFEEASEINGEDIRISGGAELRWFTPIGPIRLSYGVPLKKKDGDSKQGFQFTLGLF